MRRTSGQTSYDTSTSDTRVDDWDYIPEFSLKGRIKICAALNGTEAVAVGQFRKDADVAVIFKLNA
jgi:hypothetical protein